MPIFSERLRRQWHWAAIVAVVLVAFADPFFSGRVLFYRDLGNLMHPVLSSAVASTRLTESVPFAFWTHLLSSGRPMLARKSSRPRSRWVIASKRTSSARACWRS